jgi:hypothetical protein
MQHFNRTNFNQSERMNISYNFSNINQMNDNINTSSLPKIYLTLRNSKGPSAKDRVFRDEYSKEN